jgi:hypothetical protein
LTSLASTVRNVNIALTTIDHDSNVVPKWLQDKMMLPFLL